MACSWPYLPEATMGEDVPPPVFPAAMSPRCLLAEGLTSSLKEEMLSKMSDIIVTAGIKRRDVQEKIDEWHNSAIWLQSFERRLNKFMDGDDYENR
ncbi:hypothetical protein E2C01_071116 [Portunus trituberculatus]|uniref:Uncharacterized protein n=1 Tax=Portunus trituberculatus TaxID=210409 RepID=A0A5B7HZ62_PORTR|nr:hypothetical protein [Portunus trituberculatus]